MGHADVAEEFWLRGDCGVVVGGDLGEGGSVGAVPVFLVVEFLTVLLRVFEVRPSHLWLWLLLKNRQLLTPQEVHKVLLARNH